MLSSYRLLQNNANGSRKPFTTQIFQRGERLFCCPYIYR